MLLKAEINKKIKKIKVKKPKIVEERSLEFNDGIRRLKYVNFLNFLPLK